MIAIKTLNKLPENCSDCPCYNFADGHCQADYALRSSEYRPFWCPLEEKNEAQESQEIIATISKCPPYDILNIFNSKEEAIKDIIATTACSEEVAEKQLIHLKPTIHTYMFAGRINCLSGAVMK